MERHLQDLINKAQAQVRNPQHLKSQEIQQRQMDKATQFASLLSERRASQPMRVTGW